MFRHVGIVVEDLEQQLRFYTGLLGLEVYYDKVEQGPFLETILGIYNVKPRIYKLGKNGKIVVELLHFGTNTLVGTPKNLVERGLTHFAITVKNIDDLYAKLFKEVQFVSAPAMSDTGKHIVCFCRDFEGNYIELVEEL